jgi:2-phosphoglycerate kinase
MINVIGLGLKLGMIFVNLFVRRAERRAALKRDMMDLARKHDAAVMQNVRLRRQYNQLVRQIRETQQQQRNDEPPPP